MSNQDPIGAELTLHCTLRFLAGASYLDVMMHTCNVGSYFSGHYQSYGVNVQATCDAECRFTSISILCPGGTGDSKAFAASYLHQYVSSLPQGIYLVGDNAYLPLHYYLPLLLLFHLQLTLWQLQDCHFVLPLAFSGCRSLSAQAFHLTTSANK